MSVTRGALESVNEFLTNLARRAGGAEFPWWNSDSGRWALAHYAEIQQSELEDLPGDGILLRWRFGDLVAEIRIRPTVGKPGLWLEVE